jgi:hypothetical protein
VFSSVLICCHAQSNWGSGRIFAETKLVPVQGVCIVAPARQIVAVSKPAEEPLTPLQPQVVVYGNLDILLRPEIAFGRLDRGMAQEEFDLLEVPATLPAELGAGTAQVVSAEVLDPDLPRGLVGSLAVGRLMRDLLYEITPLDPEVFAAVAATLLAVAVFACIVPAWRASRLDPTQALRTE